MKRSSFESRLAIGLVVLIALLLSSGILWYRGIRQLAADKDQVTRSYQVLGTLESLLGQIRAAEAAQRTFLLTQDSRAFKALDDALAEARRRIGHLQSMMGSDDPQAIRLPDLSKRLENIATVLRHTAAVRETEGFEAARALLESATNLRDDSLVPLMERDESLRLQRRIDAADRTARTVVLTGVVTGVAGVLAVGLVAWVFARHLGERSRRERMLDRQRRHLGATLSSIADGVITTNEVGVVTFLNDAAELLTGWSRAEAGGLPLDHVFVVHDRHTGKRVENVALRALGGGRVIGASADHVLVARDGRQWLLSDSAAPIPGNQGQVAGAVLVFRAVQEPAVPVSLAQALPEATSSPVVGAPASSPRWLRLGDIARRLAATNDIATTLQLASDEARLLVGCHQAYTTLNDGELTDSLTRASFSERHAEWVNDPARNGQEGGDAMASTPSAAPTQKRPPAKGWLGVALPGPDERSIGLLEVCEKDAGSFAEEDEVALVQLASLTSAAITRIRAEEAMRELENGRDTLLSELTRERERPVDPEVAPVAAAAAPELPVAIEPYVAVTSEADDAAASGWPTFDIPPASADDDPMVAPPSLVEATAALPSPAVDETSITPVAASGWRATAPEPLESIAAQFAAPMEAPVPAEPAVAVDEPVVALAPAIAAEPVATPELPAIPGPQLEAEPVVEPEPIIVGELAAEDATSVTGGPAEMAEPVSTFVTWEPMPALARAASSTRPASPVSIPVPSFTRHQRILIVDPDQTGNERLAFALTISGHDVRSATSGLQALAVATHFEPTVMLLDASLPGLTCTDVARRARQEAWGSQVMLVAMRGRADDTRGRDSVFDQQLLKPVDPAVWQTSLAPVYA